MTIIETKRLRLREMHEGDASFIHKLLNDRTFLKNVGDRGVHSPADARRYIADGPARSYRDRGFGLWLVELSTHGIAVGTCGLLQRGFLPVPDLGFAYLPAYRRRGIGYEAAQAVLQYADHELALDKLAAITAPGNRASIALLGKLGFALVGVIEPHGTNDPVQLFERSRPARPDPEPGAHRDDRR